jgi:superfamily II DNA/RNA helicase
LKSGTFTDLGVLPVFLRLLEERGIGIPSEIQKRVIGRIAAGESLVFRSPTGTGKTFAYLLPLLEKVLGLAGKSGRPLSAPALIICAPTYELCSQIKGEADFLLAGLKATSSPVPRCSLLIGSVPLSRQAAALKKEKPLAVAGNPGRLLLLARMGKLKLGETAALVLDEGDRLVSDELMEETGALVRLVRDARRSSGAGGVQTAACSATFSPTRRERLVALMGELSPGGVAVEEAGENEVLRDQVEHWAFFSEERQKLSLLNSLIAALDKGGKKAAFKALVFTGRGGQVGNIVSRLRRHKRAASGLWGDMDKKSRKQALDDFRAGRVHLLVTSDLAARGLDIAGLSHIIALDTGEDPDAYIHRAGRTARAGKRGVMITIGDEEEMRRLARLEKRLGIKVYPKELYGGKVEAPSPL